MGEVAAPNGACRAVTRSTFSEHASGEVGRCLEQGRYPRGADEGAVAAAIPSSYVRPQLLRGLARPHDVTRDKLGIPALERRHELAEAAACHVRGRHRSGQTGA